MNTDKNKKKKGNETSARSSEKSKTTSPLGNPGRAYQDGSYTNHGYDQGDRPQTEEKSTQNEIRQDEQPLAADKSDQPSSRKENDRVEDSDQRNDLSEEQDREGALR